MASIRALDVMGAKWANVTPARAAEYTAGVQSPRASWAREAAAAQPAWEAGGQASLAAKAVRQGSSQGRGPGLVARRRGKGCGALRTRGAGGASGLRQGLHPVS